MKTFAVLMYHSVSPVGGRLRRLGTPPSALLDQLTLLRNEGYELLGLTEAFEAAAKDPTRAVVALTFDDGYRDFTEVAVPILTAVGARATVYVPTMHVGRSAAWLGAGAESLPALMSWDELRRCVNAGCVEVGSHSHSHAQLDTLPPAALRRELADSKEMLERNLQITVDSFCYPHGYHTLAVRDAVRAAGYGNACEVGRRLRSTQHQWSISRIAVDSTRTPAQVLNDVRSGGPIVAPAAKRALRPIWRQVRLRCPNIEARLS